MTAATCPECGGAMQPGTLGDRANGNVAGTAFWMEGKPEPARFLGTVSGIQAPNRARFDVTTFRCERCGLLRSYALPGDRW